MKFASRSAIESDNSAKAGSNASRGNSEDVLPAMIPCPSRKEVRELGRSGVVGLDEGLLRDWEAERLFPLLSILQRSQMSRRIRIHAEHAAASGRMMADVGRDINVSSCGLAMGRELSAR